jgi:hypothetical protein
MGFGFVAAAAGAFDGEGADAIGVERRGHRPAAVGAVHNSGGLDDRGVRRGAAAVQHGGGRDGEPVADCDAVRGPRPGAAPHDERRAASARGCAAAGVAEQQPGNHVTAIFEPAPGGAPLPLQRKDLPSRHPLAPSHHSLNLSLFLVPHSFMY